MTMQFNHDELMLMMLYNTGTRHRGWCGSCG